MPTWDKNIDVVARTIIGEARGCGFLDMLGVGCVIRERVLRPGWWGIINGHWLGWYGVCRRKWQFSCWQDHNIVAMLQAEERIPHIWQLAWRVAEIVVNEIRDDDVAQLFGIDQPFPTHYHDWSIDTPKAWGNGWEEIEVPWKSAFRWYRNVAGTPPRKER